MKKLYASLPNVCSAVMCISGAYVLYSWASSYSSWTLREHLKTLSPLFLEIAFVLIILAVAITVLAMLRGAHYKEVFSGITRKTWLYLAAIVVAGGVLLGAVVPRDHRIYYDEDIYQNIAQNIAYTKGSGSHYGETYGESFAAIWKRITGTAGMCNEGKNEYGEYTCSRLEYNKQPNGWPYVLSVVFRLCGVHELAAFLTNNVIFLLSIVTVFLICFLLFGDARAGLYSSLMLALTPEYLIWSNSVAVEPSAAFFAALAVLCALVFLKSGSAAALFLSVVVAGFAIQFRPESVMICIVIGFLYLLRGRQELQKSRFYLMLSVFFILIIPHCIHLYAVKDLGWGGSGPKLSLDYFVGNFKVNSLFYIRNMRFPLIITVFFFLGIVLKNQKANSYCIREKLVVFVWFALFWAIFVFFYAGSYNYGADVRFSLLSAIPLALFAGCGASSFAAILEKRFSCGRAGYLVTGGIVLLCLSFLPMLRAITQEAWAARADHRFAEIMAEELPQNSIVMTHNPNMFLLWGKNAAQASLVTEQKGYFKRFFYRYKGGVYFHHNFWCNVDDPLQNSFCKNILSWYDCTPVKTFQEKNYTYALYKVERKKKVKKSSGHAVKGQR